MKFMDHKQFLKGAALLVFTAIGSLLSRIDGGGIIKMPEWAEKALLTLPYAVIGFLCFGSLPVSILAAILCMGAAWTARATGHGQYFPELKVKAIEPERVDPVVSLGYGMDPRASKTFAHLRGLADIPAADKQSILKTMEAYGMDRLHARCMTGMAVIGLLGVSVSVIALLVSGNVWQAVALLVSGLCKAAAYHIGRPDTEKGELLYGAFQFAGAGLVIGSLL